MFFEDSSIDTEQKIPLDSTNLSVLNQSEVLEKFGQTTETLQMLNAVSNKAKGTNLNFEIETERIYSITGTNFHSLTYLVSYPNHPDFVVNLVLFSTDFRNYYPLIYKYDISVSSLNKDTKIKKEHLLPVRIKKGQHYLDALTEVPKGTNIDINDPCVQVYEKPVPNKCAAGIHFPGEACDYAGGEGAAFYSYELVIDVSDCNQSGGGSGTGSV